MTPVDEARAALLRHPEAPATNLTLRDRADAFEAAITRRESLDVERLQKAVLDEATCARWGDLHSIRWASETFAALVAERYNGTMPAEYARLEAADKP